MRTIETKVYTFDELTDEAKEKARGWWRNSRDGDDFWSEGVIEDAETCGAVLGIEIDQRQVPRMDGKYNQHPKVWFSGFSSQGDGACFEGRYQYKAGAGKAIRAHAGDAELWRIADALREVQKGAFYRLTATAKHSGHYYHSGCMDVDVDNAAGVEVTDGQYEDVKECLRDFADWIYKRLEEEWDYQNSDEVINENIRTNEYEFEEDGTRAR